MALPTFLGIGVPRGGTTWLHTVLASHPDVLMPVRRKEVRFFDRHYAHGLTWYEQFFSDGPERNGYRAIGEVSPQYLYCESCPSRIADALPGVKLVLLLRHPVERAYSQYGFVVQRRGFRGSFERFLAERPKALEMGFYARFLRKYLDRFRRDDLLALVFDEVFADVPAAERALAEFLEISADRFPAADRSQRVNASTVPVLQGVSRATVTVGRRLRRWHMEGVVDAARRIGLQRAVMRGRALPRLDPETRRRLTEVYADDIDALEGLLGLDLEAWRT